jgi:uncharacterized membrane protein HdeD (DUF308 family)
MTQSDFEQVRQAVASSLHEHWKLFLVEGIVLVVLGLIAIVVPPIATLAVELLFGWLFLLSGILGLITTFWMRNAPGFWWSLLSAVIGVVAGVLLLGWPLLGTLSLTAVLIAFLFAEGIVTLMYALEHRSALSGRWGWMLASGIVDLGLGVLLLVGLPGTALWALGLLLGINLIFGGWALIFMALHARPTATAVAA